MHSKLKTPKPAVFPRKKAQVSGCLLSIYVIENYLKILTFQVGSSLQKSLNRFGSYMFKRLSMKY